MHLNLLAKTATKLLLLCILFLLFLYNFQLLLGLLYFPREVFDIMYEDFLYSFYSLTSKFSAKVLGRKCYQLKVLKVLLMHLFVTLLINKATGSYNLRFSCNTLKNENKEFLRDRTFCILEQIEKNIFWKRIFQDALSKVHLNK